MKDLCEHCGREARGWNKTVYRDGRVWCTDCAMQAFLDWKACDCEKTPEELAQIAAFDEAMADLAKAVRAE